MSRPFFTIGHSTRRIDEFIALLVQSRVELLADIRTLAGSRRNPQFNRAALGAALAQHAIGYEHVAALGGLRGRSRTVAHETNAFWTNGSFHNYADYALSDDFRVALDRLLDEGRRRRCALMCAEALWWRCHRRIVTDHLIARGESVFHIMGPDHVEAAHLTAGAIIEPDGTVRYPPR
ncbi:MAG: DUF488 domain-containing protein [Comamonadaceae bacterium]|nr:DUF488 domain-containing protein [Comamonadaceae bacterium]